MNRVDLVKYIGKDYDKYNCFDLIKDFYMDHYNISLSNYFEGGPVPERNKVASLILSNKGDFVEESIPVFGDIVVIRLYGIECHVGVVVNDGMFLHSTRGVGSNMEKLSKYKRMIAGYYRHRGNHG